MGDKFIRTPQEKDDFRKAIEEQLASKWVSDNSKDSSFLTRNIRPLTLVWCLTIFSIIMFFDGNVGDFKIDKSYIPIFQVILTSVVNGYFLLRSIEKIKIK